MKKKESGLSYAQRRGTKSTAVGDNTNAQHRDTKSTAVELSYAQRRCTKSTAVGDNTNPAQHRDTKSTATGSTTETEKKKYLLPEARDLEILLKCREIESLNINENDRNMVELIKSQLENDWRKYLLAALNQLLKKYKS
jgi:hypothetical protein